MSDQLHDKNDIFTCPNCSTSYNKHYHYCPKCGQETHLHSESFWGLIMHFISHYFHYDSKFWQTMKVLWFKPGQLTIAYRLKQRMRYIAPVSLYIFISVVFFLIFSMMYSYRESLVVAQKVRVSGTNRFIKLGAALSAAGDSINTANQREIMRKITAQDSVLATYHNRTLNAADSLMLNKQLAIYNKLKQEYSHLAKLQQVPADNTDIIDKGMHMAPKIFFFMIPVMGLLLLLLFYRQKNFTYTDHIIFALHYHTFWFSFMLIYVLYNFNFGKLLLLPALLLISVVYMIVALRKVYSTSWVKAIFYSIIISISYLILLLIPLLTMIAILYRDYL